MAGPPFAVYYSSPEDMARGEMEFDVGIPFIGEAEGEGKIEIKTFPAHEVLSAIHKGPYNQIAPVYAALMEHAHAKRLRGHWSADGAIPDQPNGSCRKRLAD